jgi:hypothetical protein
MQASTTFDAFNQRGELTDIGAPYVTMPFDVSFDMTIVFDNIDNAIRMAEYLSVLSIIAPTCTGDDYTESIVEFSTSSPVKNDLEKQQFQLTNSVKLYVRLVEPVVNSMNDENTFLPLVSWVLQNGGNPEDVGYTQPAEPDEIQHVLDVFGNAVVHNVFASLSEKTDETPDYVGTRYYFLNRPPAPNDEE